MTVPLLLHTLLLHTLLLLLLPLKPYDITNIKSYVPLILDLDELNYDAWRELFETHYVSFGVIGHVDGTTTATLPIDSEWKHLDGLVKLWIYGAITKSLLQMILKKGVAARELWLNLENLFRDNKDARAIQLDNDLRNIKMGDLLVTAYRQRLKTLSDLLFNIDVIVSEKTFISYMVNALLDKFEQIGNIIRHQNPFPSFLQT